MDGVAQATMDFLNDNIHELDLSDNKALEHLSADSCEEEELQQLSEEEDGKFAVHFAVILSLTSCQISTMKVTQMKDSRLTSTLVITSQMLRLSTSGFCGLTKL